MVEDCEFDGPPDEPHEFETDVRKVVLTNLDLVLDGIVCAHVAEVKKFRPPDNGLDQQPYIDWIGSRYDGLRKAAINLALVGLVTRFHHWLTYLANIIRDAKDQTFDDSVAKEISFLNSRFKNSSYKCSDFKKWTDVRDSIIHADSKASWTFKKKPRSVAPQFAQLSELNFTQADLDAAFQHMLAAIGWYMNQVDQWVEKNKGPQITVGGVPMRRLKNVPSSVLIICPCSTRNVNGGWRTVMNHEVSK
jgi:hypothetical protein